MTLATVAASDVQVATPDLGIDLSRFAAVRQSRRGLIIRKAIRKT